MGTAADIALHTRAKSLGRDWRLEPSDMGAKTTWLAQKFTRLTGMATYDEFLDCDRDVESDVIARAVQRGNLSAMDRLKLGGVGIGDEELNRSAPCFNSIRRPIGAFPASRTPRTGRTRALLA